MSVYVDTSAFLAVFNVEDMQHEPAVGTWVKMLEGREMIITSNYVVVETVSLLHKRHGVQAVRHFIEEILPVVLIEWVDTSVHMSAVSAVLASSSKQSPSLVDCVSFEMIRKNRIDEVFAYDRHYEDRGFNLIG